MRLVFTDLDDCLFSTKRKQTCVLANCRPVARTSAGEVSGWQNPAQEALWDCLSTSGVMVPVTARTRAALARVALEWGPHAIWCQGGAVRVHGEDDVNWHQASQQAFDVARPGWSRLKTALATWPMMADVRMKIGEDQEFGPVNLTLLGARVDQHARAVADLSTALGENVWVHTQEDCLTMWPASIQKEHAVRHLIQKLHPTLTVGVGDSLSDVPFLALCDQVVMPSRSRAFRHLHAQLSQDSVL